MEFRRVEVCNAHFDPRACISRCANANAISVTDIADLPEKLEPGDGMGAVHGSANDLPGSNNPIKRYFLIFIARNSIGGLVSQPRQGLPLCAKSGHAHSRPFHEPDGQPRAN